MPNLHYQIFFKGPLPQSRGQKGHEGRLQVHGCKTSVREAAFSIQVLTIYKCSDRIVGCVTSFCQILGNIDRPTGCSLKIVFFEDFNINSGLWHLSVSPRCQCMYTQLAGRKPAPQQNWQSSEKSQNFKEKTQFLMNTL